MPVAERDHPRHSYEGLSADDSCVVPYMAMNDQQGGLGNHQGIDAIS